MRTFFLKIIVKFVETSLYSCENISQEILIKLKLNFTLNPLTSACISTLGTSV